MALVADSSSQGMKSENINSAIKPEVQRSRAEISAASAEKGRNSLGKLARNLLLTAIPLTVLGLAGDVYLGGAISGALGGVIRGFSTLNLTELFSGNGIQEIAQTGERITNETIIGGVGNYNPGMENFNTVAQDPEGSLNKLISGQDIVPPKS